MERGINRWLIITAVLAAAFAALAFLIPGESLGSSKEGDEYFPLCEYISVDLLKTDVTVIPYEGDRIRMKYRNDVPLTAELGDNSLTISESGEFVVSLFANEHESYGMYLYLPREYYRDIPPDAPECPPRQYAAANRRYRGRAPPERPAAPG